ncbi:hypothetical protein BH10PSE7_BH10PSE7_11180 [soil metagenome]
MAACGLAAAVSACAAVPRLPYEDGVGVADIIRNVRCELARAVIENAPKHPWIKTWAAGIELTLDVTESGGAGVNAEILVPLNNITDGTLGANLHRFRRAQSISSITFATMLAQVSETDCVPPADGKRNLLRGELGLKTWLARAADAIDATGIGAQTSGVGYVIEFGVIASGGLDPRFSLLKLDKSGDTRVGVDGGATFSASRDDTHTLNIAIAPIYPALPAQVYVTNFGDLDLGPTTVTTRTGKKVTTTKVQGVAPVRPAGIPQSTQQDLNNIIRSLKQSQNADD